MDPPGRDPPRRHPVVSLRPGLAGAAAGQVAGAGVAALPAPGPRARRGVLGPCAKRRVGCDGEASDRPCWARRRGHRPCARRTGLGEVGGTAIAARHRRDRGRPGSRRAPATG
jgi:hypothetical protein